MKKTEKKRIVGKSFGKKLEAINFRTFILAKSWVRRKMTGNGEDAAEYMGGGALRGWPVARRPTGAPGGAFSRRGGARPPALGARKKA